MVSGTAVVAALLAAALFAVANNVQRSAAASKDHADAGPLRLLLRLLTTPRWLAGSTAALVALAVQAQALAWGGVILVQSVIASTLVFSLLIEAFLERRPPRPAQVVGSVLVVGGIAVLVGLGRPHVDSDLGSLWLVAAVLLVVCVIGGGGLWAARRRPEGRRTAIVLGAAAGICFALDAVFLRGIASALGPRDLVTIAVNGVGFAGASFVGNLLIARAFQRAPLRHVLPAMAAAEPLTAVLVGRFVFDERLGGGAAATVGVVLGLVLMTLGVVACAQGHARVAGGAPGRPSQRPSVVASAD